MSMGDVAEKKVNRFTDFTATDLMIRHSLEGNAGNERIIYEVGAVRRMAWYFNMMEGGIKRVASSKTGPWYFDKRGCRLTADAKELWNILRNIDESPKELCKGRRLNPWLKIGLHLAYKWEPRLRFFTNADGMLDINLDYARRMMAHIFKFIHRTCKSARFRAWVNNDTRNAKDNYESCCTCCLDVLRVHARLLMLRVDLYFEGDAKGWSESNPARKAYNKFIRNLSTSKIIPDVLIYIGKRENGLERRIHFHVLVALDGDKHQQAFSLSEKLGRYWVRDCIGSSVFGSYKNCYERKDEYKHNCLGSLHYADEEMLKGLRDALRYMCKEGAHIFVGKDMGRNLRKSQAPKLPAVGKRRGAPRKYGNDTALAEQVLLPKAKVPR